MKPDEALFEENQELKQERDELAAQVGELRFELVNRLVRSIAGQGGGRWRCRVCLGTARIATEIVHSEDCILTLDPPTALAELEARVWEQCFIIADDYAGAATSYKKHEAATEIANTIHNAARKAADD